MNHSFEKIWTYQPTWLAWLQGGYFATFGIWPIVDVSSFQSVTGHKFDHLPNGTDADHWLVYTVGLLLSGIGAVLLLAAYRQHISMEIALLGLFSATALLVIDLVYVARGVISSIYLVDAAIECAIAGAWIVTLWRSTNPSGT